MEITHRFNLKDCPNKFNTFKKIKKCYIDYLNKNNLTYKKYKKHRNEIVFVVEKSLIVFIYITKTTYLPTENVFNEYNFEKAYPNGHPPTYSVFVQEMNHNNILKFNYSKFCNDNDFNYLEFQYFPFNGFKHIFGQIKESVQYFMKSYPKFELDKIYSVWNGIPYHAIIFEANMDNVLGYALCLTQSINLHSFARQQFDILYTTIYPNNRSSNTKYGYFSNSNSLENDYNFTKIIERIINICNYTKQTKYELYSKHIKYYIVDIYIKEPNLLHIAKEKLFDRIYNYEFENYERFQYTDGRVKWKSEQLVYDCLKKMYGKNVIYQYRPLWLQTRKGNMTYDFYLPKLKIAIEYQGKQHFEPVEIFGGEDGFIKCQQRDKLKAVLSNQNGIKLIYVNYWEEISLQLLKNKIEEN